MIIRKYLSFSRVRLFQKFMKDITQSIQLKIKFIIKINFLDFLDLMLLIINYRLIIFEYLIYLIMKILILIQLINKKNMLYADFLLVIFTLILVILNL